MARNITYEILVQQGNRWEIHARHGVAHKDAALNEAKALESLPGIRAVKVIKETYDTVEGDTEEATVYKSALDPAKGAADPVETTSSRVSPYRRPPSAAGAGRTQGKPSGGTLAGVAGRRPARPAPSTNLGIFTKVLLVIFFSIAFAALVTGLVALMMRDFTIFGIRISPDTYANVLFGVFVLGFLFSAIPLALKFLSKEQLESHAGASRRVPAPRKPAKRPAYKSAMTEEKM